MAGSLAGGEALGAATTRRFARRSSGATCARVRNMRQAFGGGLLARVGARGARDGRRAAASRRATGRPSGTRRTSSSSRAGASSYPAPDGALTFDKLSSVFLSGNRTRDDQPSHIRLADARAGARSAELWARMCPAQVYEVGAGARTAWSRSRSTPSNCVQCGAITAKGGRLTPPEGGSGPEYTLT